MVSNLDTVLTGCIFQDIYCNVIIRKILSVVYLLRQELLVDKIYFIKFHSISDKAQPNWLKIITSASGTSLSESFHSYSRPTRKGKYPVLRTCANAHQLNKAH